MNQSRPETEADAEPVDSREARDRFEALADKIRQESHLPPQGDQSWREREAMQRAAYDRGYMPPQGDQSWRDHEAMRFVPTREEDAVQMPTNGDREPLEPILSSAVPTAKGGHGGIVLALCLVVAIVLGIAMLANPDILTAGYWRAHQDETTATVKLQNAPANVAPAAPPKTPPVPPPALTPEPAMAPSPAPQAKRPAPPQTPAVPQTAQHANAPVPPQPIPKPRAAAPTERSAGGFYAKVPGPDGTLKETYFPSTPETGSRPPARKEPAVPSDAGGFYARAIGPDGTMQYRYFPAKPQH